MSENYMPVLQEWSNRDRKDLPTLRIPWEMIANHDAQARLNHCNQGLVRLRARYGISRDEALAILDDRKWHGIELHEAHDELERRITDWKAKNP